MWVIGFAILGGLIVAMVEKQTIHVGRGKIIFKKFRPLFSGTLDYNFTDIQQIALKQASFYSSPQAWRFQGRHAVPDEMPSIITGAGTKVFFENANHAEKVWIIQYLSQKMAQAKRW